MLKKVFLLGLILIMSNVFAQHTITGKMKPAKAEYTWLILYKLNGISQKYISNGTVKDGKFTISIPKGSPTGMYRLLYDNTKNKFLDFIFNNENITVEFHPDYPSQLVKYDKSDENIAFQKYIDKVSVIQNRLDSLQVKYFKTKDTSTEKKLNELYAANLKILKTEQTSFETKTKDKLAYHFIVANKRFYSDYLIKDTNKYLQTIKNHYFDYVNFDDAILKKSSLLIDRIMDFVFYLNTSKDSNTLRKLRKEGIVTVLSKIKNDSLKKEVVESLLYTFAQQEDINLVDYIFQNHFNKLPVALQDYEFKMMINDMMKTTVGNKAPEITWQENGKTKNLYGLKGKKYYLVVFWSSTCSHCLKEMPLLHKYLEDKKDFQVLAIGLETKESQIGWIDEKFYYENFIHILGKDKFNNKYVKDYGVNATPSFFLMDDNKNIIAKPYDVKEFKEVYTKLHKK